MMIDKGRVIDLGIVTNLAIIQKPGASETLLIVGMSEMVGRWARVMTRGAAQALWFHLTHILYPRAAVQITPRAATAALRHTDAPTVTSFLEVKALEQEKIIAMRGLGGLEAWVVRFSYDEGHELWASLEKILDSV
jgi:hypothetical protein